MEWNWVKKIGDTKRKQGSRRPQTSPSNVNINTVENLTLSQGSDPGIHLGIKLSWKQEYHKHLFIGLQNLTMVSNKQMYKQSTREDEKKRTEREKRLLRYITLASLEKTFFTDEKIFKLQAPNNKQNDRICKLHLSKVNFKSA